MGIWQNAAVRVVRTAGLPSQCRLLKPEPPADVIKAEQEVKITRGSRLVPRPRCMRASDPFEAGSPVPKSVRRGLALS